MPRVRPLKDCVTGPPNYGGVMRTTRARQERIAAGQAIG